MSILAHFFLSQRNRGLSCAVFGIFFLQVLKEPWGEYMKDERKAFRKRVVSYVTQLYCWIAQIRLFVRLAVWALFDFANVTGQWSLLPSALRYLQDASTSGYMGIRITWDKVKCLYSGIICMLTPKISYESEYVSVCG